MRQWSIRTKLTVAILVVLGLFGFSSAGIIFAVYRTSANYASEEAVRGAAAAYEALERHDTEKLSTALDMVVANPAIRDAFAARDRDRLYALTAPMLQGLKTEHGIGIWNFIEGEPSRQVYVLRVHQPGKYGDVARRFNLARAMETRDIAAGKEMEKAGFALRVARPFTSDGKIIGYVELGEDIDSFLEKMKAQTGNDFALFVNKSLLEATEYERARGTSRDNWGDFPDVVVVNQTTDEQDPLVDAAAIRGLGLGKDGKVLPTLEREGGVFARGVFPARDAAGQVMGGLVLRRDITRLRDGAFSGVTMAIALVILLSLGTAGLVYFLANRLVFQRLRQMKGTMQDLSMRLAGGDFSAGDVVRPTSDDEIGSFEAFFGEFLGVVRNTLRDLSENVKQARQGRQAAPPDR